MGTCEVDGSNSYTYSCSYENDGLGYQILNYYDGSISCTGTAIMYSQGGQLSCMNMGDGMGAVYTCTDNDSPWMNISSSLVTQ